MMAGQKRNGFDYLMLWIKGILMGTANKVPGVSGGTVAFVAGFYEEFIFSLRRFNTKSLRLILKGRFRSFVKYTNLKFLLCIMAGTVTSFFSVSLVLDYLMDHFKVQVWSVFFGMVLGSLYFLIKKYKTWTSSTVFVMLIGLAVGLSVSMFDYAAGSKNLFIVFVCGVISVCGMTLPGLSGSFLLMLVGNYKLLMVDSVNAVFFSVKNLFIGDTTLLFDSSNVELINIFWVFTLGTMIGVVLFSHILGWLLKHYYHRVIAGIIGFIAGSLSIMWPWKDDIYQGGTNVVVGFSSYLPDVFSVDTIIGFMFILTGIIFILKIEQHNENLRSKHNQLKELK